MKIFQPLIALALAPFLIKKFALSLCTPSLFLFLRFLSLFPSPLFFSISFTWSEMNFGRKFLKKKKKKTQMYERSYWELRNAKRERERDREIERERNSKRR